MTADIAHAGEMRLLNIRVCQADQSGQAAKGMVDKVKHRPLQGTFAKLSAAFYSPLNSIS